MAWQVTALSVKDAAGGYVTTMADTDKETIGFDAQEAIASAAATLRDLNQGIDLATRTTGQTAQPAPIEAVSLAGNVVSVTVFGLTRGTDYELAVTFQTAGGRKWTRTRIIECRA
jgi:hypothetical protein